MVMKDEDERWQDMTSCQMYGHVYESDDAEPRIKRCRDCGDTYIDDPTDGERIEGDADGSS